MRTVKLEIAESLCDILTQETSGWIDFHTPNPKQISQWVSEFSNILDFVYVPIPTYLSYAAIRERYDEAKKMMKRKRKKKKLVFHFYSQSSLSFKKLNKLKKDAHFDPTDLFLLTGPSEATKISSEEIKVDGVFVNLAGSTFHAAAFAKMKKGERVTFKHDSSNKFDHAAIAIYYKSEQVGFVSNSPKTLAENCLHATKARDFIEDESEGTIIGKDDRTAIIFCGQFA